MLSYLSKWMIDLKQGFAFKAILLVQESISLSVSFQCIH